MKNGLMPKLIGGLIVALLLSWVSYMVGQGTLGTRVTILETRWEHIAAHLEDHGKKLDKLLGID